MIRAKFLIFAVLSCMFGRFTIPFKASLYVSHKDGGMLEYSLKGVKQYSSFYKLRFSSKIPTDVSNRTIEVLIKKEGYPFYFLHDPFNFTKLLKNKRFVNCSNIYRWVEVVKGSDVHHFHLVYDGDGGWTTHLDLVSSVYFPTSYPMFNLPSLKSLPNPVYTNEDAKKVLEFVKKYLFSRFNMVVFYPVRVKLVNRAFLDAKQSLLGKDVEGFCKSPVYTRYGEYPMYYQIYYLRGVSLSDFIGAMSHEMTHAWEYENCPNSDTYIKEGLAQWIEWKTLTGLGFYKEASKVYENVEPEYIKGFLFFKEMEKKYTPKEILKRVRNITTIKSSENL